MFRQIVGEIVGEPVRIKVKAKEGKKSLFTLCEAIPEYFRLRKREPITSSLISNKFRIDEQWIIKNEAKFEFVRNEAFDECMAFINSVLRKAAPEKSVSLNFWMGFVTGLGIMLALGFGGFIIF